MSNLTYIKKRIKDDDARFRFQYKIAGSEKNTLLKPHKGLHEFDSELKLVKAWKPEIILVDLFFSEKTKPDETLSLIEDEKKAVKAVSRKTKQVIESPENQIFMGIQALGGIDGVIQNSIDAKTLARENFNLEKKVNQLETQVEKYTEKIESLREENSNLKEKAKELQFDLGRAEKEMNYELDRAGRNAFSTEKIMTVLGTVGANIMGVTGEKLQGLLGLSADKSDETPAISASDKKVVFEKSEESQAEKHKAEINNWLATIIAQNPKDADNIVSKVYEIMIFIAKDPNNLQTLHELAK